MAALDRGTLVGRRQGTCRSTRVAGARAGRRGAHADAARAWRPARGGPAHGMAVGHAARIGPAAPDGVGSAAGRARRTGDQLCLALLRERAAAHRRLGHPRDAAHVAVVRLHRRAVALAVGRFPRRGDRVGVSGVVTAGREGTVRQRDQGQARHQRADHRPLEDEPAASDFRAAHGHGGTMGTFHGSTSRLTAIGAGLLVPGRAS